MKVSSWLFACLAFPATATLAALSVNAQKSISFQQNSKKMFDEVLARTPFLFRAKSQRKLENAIADICTNNVVYEKDVYEAVRRVSPSLFVQASIDACDAHATAN